MTQVRACLISVYNVSLMRMEGKRGLVRERGKDSAPVGSESPPERHFYNSHVRGPGPIPAQLNQSHRRGGPKPQDWKAPQLEGKLQNITESK